MATFQITAPDGRTFEVTAPDGTPQEEVLKYAQANMPAVEQAGSALNDIPRQLGLAARHGAEGVASGLELFTEPVRYFTDKLMPGTKTVPLSSAVSRLADTVGLPKPKNATERVVADASKTLMSAATFGGGAKKAADLTTGAASKVFASLADNLPQQFAAATGAGLAGGASREAGGTPVQQGVSALVGGLGGAGAYSAGKGLTNAATGAVKSLMPANQQQIDLKLTNLLRQSGVDYGALSERMKQTLRSELQSSLNAGDDLNPAAVSRLLAFRQAGVTPTRGMISQNPVQITREQNLAKMGANSSDEGLQGLAQVQNRNNQALIGNLNQMGAAEGDPIRAGEAVTSSILGRQSMLRGAEQSAWDAAKGSPGYTAPISAFPLSQVNAALGDEALMPFLNPQISRYMEAFQTGQQPFTPQAYRNLMSMLSNEASKGGNEAAAAALAKRILVNADLRPAGFSNPGALPVTQQMGAAMNMADDAARESIDAVDAARRATRQAYEFEGMNPLVRSVLSDGASSDPQRIAQRFVIGGTANEMQDVLQQVGPQGARTIRDAVLNHLKTKALSGASDEVGKFSQSSFNNALRSIGERKLALIFTPEELASLRNNGRVAALMMSQPVGSAVNNSNSGALLLGRGYDAVKAIAGKVPLGQSLVVDPLNNLSLSINTRRAQNVLPGLLAEQPTKPMAPTMLLPALSAAGLLASPGVERP